jgi:hypothetical protein
MNDVSKPLKSVQTVVKVYTPFYPPIGVFFTADHPAFRFFSSLVAMATRDPLAYIYPLHCSPWSLLIL